MFICVLHIVLVMTEEITSSDELLRAIEYAEEDLFSMYHEIVSGNTTSVEKEARLEKSLTALRLFRLMITENSGEDVLEKNNSLQMEISSIESIMNTVDEVNGAI